MTPSDEFRTVLESHGFTVREERGIMEAIDETTQLLVTVKLAADADRCGWRVTDNVRRLAQGTYATTLDTALTDVMADLKAEAYADNVADGRHA